jgi:4a-hydroxytetrahydrobiopterin dehydratase
MKNFATLRCRPLAPGTPAMSAAEIAAALTQLHGWREDGGMLTKRYTFPDYSHTLSFVNAVAGIAHAEDHHPEITMGYGHCVVRYNTHSIGGISENDFICAAKIDHLLDHERG